MGKSYTVLQKKIKELEALLGNLFTAPPAESPCHQIHAEDVEQRLLFLKNLLSAELSSHPTDSHHLHGIDRRLADLEAAFRAWDGIRVIRTTSLPSLPLDHAHNPVDDGSAASTGSCTESCFNGDGDATSEVMGLIEDDRRIEKPFTEEESNVGGGLVGKEKEVRVKRRRRREEGGAVECGGRYLAGMASGVVVGAIFMGFVMLKFSSCFYEDNYRVFPLPT